VVCNLLIVIALFGVLPIILAVIGNLTLRGPYVEYLVEFAGWIMPYVFLGSTIDGFSDTIQRSWRGQIWLPVLGYGVPPFEFKILMLFMGSLHLFIAGLILLYTADRFDQLVERAPQEKRKSQRIPPIPAVPST
jgi:hypothetical protein